MSFVEVSKFSVLLIKIESFFQVESIFVSNVFICWQKVYNPKGWEVIYCNGGGYITMLFVFK